MAVITGVGVDIVSVRRFERPANARFILRVFTAKEQDYLKGKTAASMAGLFAAKEAVAKAIGTGFRGFWPRDIEILRDELGKPYAVLHGGAKKAAGETTALHISISHTATDAVAFAVAAGMDKPPSYIIL